MTARPTLALAVALLAAATATLAADTVPNEIRLPGTQPGEAGPLSTPTQCSICHAGTPNPEFEPTTGWQGSMMAHAGRDPLFWAALAIAEQDFLPDPDPAVRGGVGDFCIRCHSPSGWLEGRSLPTDGSGLLATDDDGVECELCHLMVDPDLPVNVTGTVELQTAPYLAHDEVTGDGYHGAAQYVLNGELSRLGPYADSTSNHAFRQSSYYRDGAMCGTCHDVSNSAVGDLAHNNGALVPLDPTTFSGNLGDPVDTKAAFNNPPHAYGVLERTYSEWWSSALRDFRVNDFTTLPAELQTAGGALERAFFAATAARGDADHEDGAARYYTCQTCHMMASTGVGCDNFGAPTRTDLGRHDLTGAATWTPDAILYQDDLGTLRLGGGLTRREREDLLAGRDRARASLASAASLTAAVNGSDLDVRITNLTGHKLTTGYPEGRRMWLHLRWYDDRGQLMSEEGAYGPIGRTAPDRLGDPVNVLALLDPAATITFETEPGLDQQWAQQLIAFGWDPALALTYAPLTDAVGQTLGDLAALAPGSATPTFHFALNNVVTHDDRLPPYGLRYDDALGRSALPTPATLYGDPGPGGTYDHWADVSRPIPVGAARVDVRLFHQQATWQYIQFLWLANDGQNAFLGGEGVNILDTWLMSGQSPPTEMARATLWLVPPLPPGEAASRDQAGAQMRAVRDKATGAITVTYGPACNATDHTVYHGPLADVATYGYDSAACDLGDAGVATFDPSPDDIFFVIAGNNGTAEGSYGPDDAGGERPAATGLACEYPQDLSGACDQ